MFHPTALFVSDPSPMRQKPYRYPLLVRAFHQLNFHADPTPGDTIAQILPPIQRAFLPANNLPRMCQAPNIPGRTFLLYDLIPLTDLSTPERQFACDTPFHIAQLWF